MTVKHKVSILFTTQILQFAEARSLGPRWLGPLRFFQAVGSQGMWWQRELHHVLKQCSAEVSLTDTPATSTSPFRCLTTVAVLFYCRFECIFLLNSFSSLFAGEIQMCFSSFIKAAEEIFSPLLSLLLCAVDAQHHHSPTGHRTSATTVLPDFLQLEPGGQQAPGAIPQQANLS